MQTRLAKILIFVSIAGISLASTCETIPTTRDVNVDDNDRHTPSGRVSYEIMPGVDTRRRGSLLDLVTRQSPVLGARRDGRKLKKAVFTLNVAGEFAMVDGRDDVDVPAGRNVQLGVEIPGPTIVDAQVKNYRGHVSVRPGGRFFDVVGIEGIVGLGFDSTELHLKSPGFNTRDENTGPAFVVGARLSLRPIPLLDLYGQLISMSGNFSSFDAEAGLQLNLTQNLGVYGGYRQWRFDKDSFRGSGSDTDFNFVGPTFGGSLTF